MLQRSKSISLPLLSRMLTFYFDSVQRSIWNQRCNLNLHGLDFRIRSVFFCDIVWSNPYTLQIGWAKRKRKYTFIRLQHRSILMCSTILKLPMTRTLECKSYDMVVRLYVSPFIKNSTNTWHLHRLNEPYRSMYIFLSMQHKCLHRQSIVPIRLTEVFGLTQTILNKRK